MRDIKHLLENNRKWSETVRSEEPEFFSKLAKQQAPEYLWIGCADSRVPANQIVNLLPGELFVHRNVGNIVIQSDLNCLSVLQFAIDVLKVKHVIVTGHYGCGAVRAAMEDTDHGLIDNWLRSIRDLYLRRKSEFDGIEDLSERIDRLCEANVVEQVRNVCRTTVLQNAWTRGQNVTVHGWIYGIGDGLVRDLDVCIRNKDDMAQQGWYA